MGVKHQHEPFASKAAVVHELIAQMIPCRLKILLRQRRQMRPRADDVIPVHDEPLHSAVHCRFTLS